MYNAIMDDPEAHCLLANLECSDGAESRYQPIVAALVADLVNCTFKSTDTAEMIRLAHLEMRARLILKRWKGRNVN